ncbi:MAG: PD-(D/E)XK nuclease family transposase [candidate division KSB1 bacterium]
MSRFMDVTTDFGFKKLFGDEANIDVTMHLINAVLEIEPPIVELRFANPAQLPESSDQRVGIYDLFCRDAAGNRYLVEMQKSRLAFIKDRMLYYSSFPLAAQAPKGVKRYQYTPPPILRVRDAVIAPYGDEAVTETEEVVSTEWNYELKAVYCIAILGYALNGSTTAVNYNSIRNDRPPHAPFYDKLKFVTVELPLFDSRRPEYRLDQPLNKWLYFLKYSADFERIPDVFKGDKVFQKAFWVAELANFSSEERRHYELSIKRTRDTYAALTTSFDAGKLAGKLEGKIEGRLEGKIEDLLLLFAQKLGPVPNDLEAGLRSVHDLERIQTLLAHFININDWETLRKHLTP